MVEQAVSNGTFHAAEADADSCSAFDFRSGLEEGSGEFDLAVDHAKSRQHFDDTLDG